MKKTLTRALTLLLILALLAVPALAEGFTDGESVGAAYAAAVDYMAKSGVLAGFEDGTFRPGETLTREQAAKIVAALSLGSAEAARLTCDAAPYSDVAAGRWSAPYIAWCAENSILSGKGDGSFAPAEALTGAAFGKMLLCATGFGKAEDYEGASWVSAVIADGRAIDLFDGDETAAADTAITRAQAALLAYNAVKAGGHGGGIDALLQVGRASLTMQREDGIKTSRVDRNIDGSLTFTVKLEHKAVKQAGSVTLKLRVYEYSSNRVICSYIFDADVAADAESTSVSYTGALADLLDYDKDICKDYFNDEQTYRLELILNSHVLGAYTLTTAFNTQAADAFARSIQSQTRFWISSNVGELVEPGQRVYSERFVGMVRTLGAQIDLSKAGGYSGQLPVVIKWYLDDSPIASETRIVDFDGEALSLDTLRVNGNNRTLPAGTYSVRATIFNNLIAEGACKLTD